MSLLKELGSVTRETRGAFLCGQNFEGICAHINGVLYKTYRTPNQSCVPIPC